MIGKHTMIMLLTAAMVASTSGMALATDRNHTDQAATSAPGVPGSGEMPMSHGMMGSGGMKGGGTMGSGGMKGGGMMDMMGMMHSCQTTMGGAMSGNAMMPHLPPGNEKLEFQMQAEMMQKMGEIATKYGDRIKEAR